MENPSFHFPFQPYDVQVRFMRELYSTIEKRRLGIFESPTGTGKSLSICCGALQWLKDHNKKECEDLENKIYELKAQISSESGSGDWLKEEYEKVKRNQMLVTLQCKLDKINKQNELFNEMRLRVSKQKLNISKKTLQHTSFNKNNLIIKDMEDIDQSEEDQDLIVEENGDENSGLEEEVVENEEDNVEFIKIYISSRTHSQLSQFIGEIKRTVFKDNIRLITLASRQHYCINEDVNKLKNVNLINERCLDMQKSKTKSTSVGEDGRVLKKCKTGFCGSCPYYNQNNITKLKERMLVEIMDMEEIVTNGKDLKACPYYASRMALDDAEVVLVSHAGIVSSGARSGVSLKLQDNILIMDEAHGLTAALENAHSAPVTRKQLSSVRLFLKFYINKYTARLSSRNLLILNQLQFVVNKLSGLLEFKGENATQKDTATVFTLVEFSIKAEIDHLNLRPLVQFCRDTRLAKKLHGFSMRYSQQALEEEVKKSTVSKKSSLESFLSNMSKRKMESECVQENNQDVTPKMQTSTETSVGSGLYAILDFLEMLCDRCENGRVLVQRSSDNGLLKYLLLNTAEHFADVIEQCRSVVVAGGTMEPISEFLTLLKGATCPTERINVVRCDHVVPSDNVLAVCLSKGPSNLNLNFSYENRMSNEIFSEVGRILRNICSLVPGGVVCFLPSYSYEKAVYDHLNCQKVIDAISKKKTVFREPKSAGEVEQVLNKYSVAVKNKAGGKTGALMLSVVGGKLSEGLNFSDDLGRCVIVVGMPYPNVKSLELQEKMNYLNKIAGGSAGNIYYENLCMKAVNQCIGRAVRHANDYACVLLVDERYSRAQTAAALPSFVQKSLKSNFTFSQTIGNVAKFFSKRKNS